MTEAKLTAVEAFVAAGHRPVLDGQGRPDDEAYDADAHNGYRCAVCGAELCRHCYNRDGDIWIDPCPGRRADEDVAAAPPDGAATARAPMDRDALARLLLAAFNEVKDSDGESGYVDDLSNGAASNVCIDGWFDLRVIADKVLAATATAGG